MLAEYPDVLTTKDVIKILSVSKEYLYELISKDKIPAYRLGDRHWRFNKETLIQYLNSHEK